MTVLLRYALEEEIGRGASGRVYRASERGPLRRTVAVKRIRGADPTIRDAVLREARILGALDHPHVVPVIDVLPDGTGTAVVMGYAAGGSLGDALARRGPLTSRQLAATLLPVADALESAHRAGIVHGDVKPANVLFTSDGEPLLSDFGAAQWIDVSADADVAVGTVGFLDPELLYSPAIDPRSDVYALGVTCYEALTGAMPFAGDDAYAILDAADRGRAPPLRDLAPEVPGAVAAVVERAMARRRTDRFASGAAFAAALREATPPAGSRDAEPRPRGKSVGAFGRSAVSEDSRVESRQVRVESTGTFHRNLARGDTDSCADVDEHTDRTGGPPCPVAAPPRQRRAHAVPRVATLLVLLAVATLIEALLLPGEVARAVIAAQTLPAVVMLAAVCGRR